MRNLTPPRWNGIEEDAFCIREAGVADAMIHLESRVVFDPFNDIPEMGRFVLEKEGRPVAGEIIL